MDVEDSADQEQRDADPRQDKTVTKVSFPQVSGVPQYLLPVEGEDEAGSEGRETCKTTTRDLGSQLCVLLRLFHEFHSFNAIHIPARFVFLYSALALIWATTDLWNFNHSYLDETELMGELLSEQSLPQDSN